MSDFYVKMWEEDVTIPTYPVGEPDKNPMFLEKRVYQGSSGKVYPLPFTDNIMDNKIMQSYHMVYLENKYLKIAILPELGGRIQRAYDKTNDYDFVYYNQVIKPALVGLAGPWISGGIEFNWPQHHRPSTFSPVDYCLQDNQDGSKTVWVSEIDRMYGTKGMAGFTLHPDKAYLEIKGQLYNGTDTPQTFLWWANPAVAVNDHTQSIFPPDVHAVFDHGKRDVSKFPIATGTYYKVDYSSGVDISRYKNLPVPTSYMAYHSDYNFIGGYDFAKSAGILHVANHHISPGKKQWTWGCGDFGQAWDRNLTDEDGPYIELMTGVHTDNQPDFSWLQPYEEKTFTQYFMPYKQVGQVKNATIDAAINLEFVDNEVIISLYTTSAFDHLTIQLTENSKIIFTETMGHISPEKAYVAKVSLDIVMGQHHYKLTVLQADKTPLISYQPTEESILETPDPAKPALQPHEIQSNEELFLTGLHLEQYRHATYEPDAYYLEGLKRDPSDSRLNNAYGLLLYRRGQFQESEKYFREAVKKITWKNPNPYDGEPYYNLGLCLKMQERYEEAFNAFYKSTWNHAWQDSGYYHLALISCMKKEYREALELVNHAIIKNYHHTKARNLKCAILRHLGRLEEAEQFAQETIAIDKLDFGSRYETYLTLSSRQATKAKEALAALMQLMRNAYHNYLELAIDYGNAGLYDEAIDVLKHHVHQTDNDAIYPMVYYYLGYYCKKNNQLEEGERYYCLGKDANGDYCFPNRLHSINILKDVITSQPKDAKAPYYLANLYYDKKQFDSAITLWEQSVSLDKQFPTVYRNLALAYFNKRHDAKQSRVYLEKAFALNTEDPRVLFELDQLYKKTGVPHEERLEKLEQHMDVVTQRDVLYLEYITLLNNLGMTHKAQELIAARKFHPWEGGEGKVVAQYIYTHMELAKKAMNDGAYHEAIALLEQTKHYPHHLGEGKLQGTAENHIDYFLGIAYEKLGQTHEAVEAFERASVGIQELSDMMFYNDQPADMMFYQGMALLKLGQVERAQSKFNQLYDYGEKHIHDHITIDYFAVSLPDFLVFDEDLNQKNYIHCLYLMGLSHLGRENDDKAKYSLEEALSLDINHQGIMTHLRMLKS